MMRCDCSLIGWPIVPSLVYPFMFTTSMISLSPSQWPRESPNQLGAQSFRCGIPSVFTSWNMVLCSNRNVMYSLFCKSCIGCGVKDRNHPNGWQLPA